MAVVFSGQLQLSHIKKLSCFLNVTLLREKIGAAAIFVLSLHVWLLRLLKPH